MPGTTYKPMGSKNWVVVCKGWFKKTGICERPEEVICSSEMSVHIQTTQHYIPEDGNIHNYCCENFKSYNVLRMLIKYY
jgi:hypothetical protein